MTTRGLQDVVPGHPEPAGLCALDARPAPDGVEVALSGELCFSTSPAIELQLLEIERDGRIATIDLRALQFIDLTGLDVVGRCVARGGASGRPPTVWMGRSARRLVVALATQER